MRRVLSLLSVCLLSACVDQNPASDVRGNYTLSYDDQLTFVLKVGGAERRATGGEDEVVTFEGGGTPLTLDMGAFCGREDVQCPSETLWELVSIDQPQIAANNPNTHVINVVNNTVNDLPDGESAAVVSGLVDPQDRFGMILGGGTKGAGTDCALLAVSTAGGRFTHEGEETVACAVADAGPSDGGTTDGGTADGDAGLPGAPCTRVTWPDGAAVDGIGEGEVKLGFLGACAFGPALIGATLEITTGYTGTRTGDFDPPPFTPLDPEDVDEGIRDAGPAAALDSGPGDAG